MRIFLGWDPREQEAYDVAASSLRLQASELLRIQPLKLAELERLGIMRRPHHRERSGVLWDDVSDQPMSTEFSLARFAVPFLAMDKWVLYADPDVVALGDVCALDALTDDRYAVRVVQHDHHPGATVKMDGSVQRAYRRKNWSSVVLWNCAHPANRRLTLDVLNTWPRDLLHGFCWLEDRDIGALPPAWNWLVGEQLRPANARLAHFTAGGPWLDGWQGAETDAIWHAARHAMMECRAGAVG